MKKRQQKREEKGITLVALIITVIILIILAAVTIYAFAKNKLIEVAINGTINYANAQVVEEEIFNQVAITLDEAIKNIEKQNSNIENIDNLEEPEIEILEKTANSFKINIKNNYSGNVQFEYYSYKKKGIVSIEDCAVLQTLGDAVLNNQRIEKIQIKIGMSPKMKFDFFRCIGNAFVDFWDDFTLIFRTLGLLIFPGSGGIRQVGVNDLQSFVGIFDLVKTFVGSGLLSLLAFTAMLSVNIGVMNLLPIPALDGGRIVFLGYELVTRKKPSKKVENIINNVFFILLMILFVYVTYNDILRLIRKG